MKSQAWEENKLALAVEVCRILQATGEAYLTGGFVRELVIHGDPQFFLVDDIDIATSVKPKAICYMLNEHGIKATYDDAKNFGVVRARGKWGDEVEVATFRSDGVYKDGRHPENVKFVSTLEEDARRRDFTCNAVYFNPSNDMFVDPVGGINDISSGTLKCVGQPIQRFEEDYLRMIRYCRFRAKLGFKFDKEIARIIRHNAHKITEISTERIKMEFDKAIDGPQFWQFISDLNRVGVLFYLLPEVAALQWIKHGKGPYHREGSVYRHTLQALRGIDSSAIYLANHFQAMADKMFANWNLIVWSVLLHDIGKRTARKVENGKVSFITHELHSRNMAEYVLNRFKFSNKDKEAILWIIENHLRASNIPQMKKGKRREIMWHPHIAPLIFVRLADDLGNLGGTRGGVKLFDQLAKMYLEEPAVQEATKILVTNELKEFTDGEMIMRELGIEPGSAVGEVKQIITTAYLEGKVTTMEDVKRILKGLKEITYTWNLS